MNPVLAAKNISKWYKEEYSEELISILNNVSLEVFPGTSTAIQGKSGEGKSTLLHILGTLENPSSGVLEIKGSVVDKKNVASVRNKNIGFVFQTFNLLEDYTVLENVLMPAYIARERVSLGSKNCERALDLLYDVGLIHRAFLPAKFLSGGEKQRASIARALFNDPDIILADEPSGNLDHQHSEIIHTLLLSIAQNKKKALLVVTHDQELSRLCDREFLLMDGSLFKISK